jgi:hypothetical protein
MIQCLTFQNELWSNKEYEIHEKVMFTCQYLKQ